MSIEDKIIDSVINNDKVKRYLELEKIINESVNIKAILDEMKSVQKDLVHARSFDKNESLKASELKYEMLLKRLEETPLLLEYLDLQDEINEFLQNSANIINRSLIVNSSHK